MLKYPPTGLATLLKDADNFFQNKIYGFINLVLLSKCQLKIFFSPDEVITFVPFEKLVIVFEANNVLACEFH